MRQVSGIRPAVVRTDKEYQMTAEEFEKLRERVKNKPDVVIGIDPDCEASGYAYLRVDTRSMVLDKLKFPELIEWIYQEHTRLIMQGMRLVVVVERGWFNLTNYHLKPGASPNMASRIGMSIGRNHETGRKILEMLKYYGVETDTIDPLRKCWKGKDGKITAEEFKMITGVTGRHNQDERDAGLIAWLYANLPVRIKPTRQ